MNVTTVKNTHRARKLPWWKRLYLRWESPLAIALLVVYIIMLVIKQGS